MKRHVRVRPTVRILVAVTTHDLFYEAGACVSTRRVRRTAPNVGRRCAPDHGGAHPPTLVAAQVH